MHLRVHQIQRKLVLVDMLEPQLRLPFLRHNEHMLESPNGGVLEFPQPPYLQAAGDVAIAEAIEALGRFHCHA